MKRPEARALQAPIAMAEYRARQEENVNRMKTLREARLAREIAVIDPQV